MKTRLIPIAACIFASLFASPASAEDRAFDNDKPRDCSGVTDAKKKMRCEAFNKALAACKSEGKKVGKELDACLMEKAKVPV